MKETLLEKYAKEHGAPVEAFVNAGYTETTYKGYPALKFTTDGGDRLRVDGGDNKYVGKSKQVWYRLNEAVKLAFETDIPLILVNGEASVVAGQYHRLPATAVTMGEKRIPDELIAQLKEAYKGQAITVVFDNDTTGKAAVTRVVKQLKGAGYTPFFVEWNSELDNGYDFADYLRDNGRDSTVSLLEGAKLYIEAVEVAEHIERVTPVVTDGSKRGEIIALLHHLSPDRVNTYEDWIRVGMIIHNELGDSGLTVWDNWSMNGASYEDGVTESKWATFNSDRGNRLGIGSLVMMVKEDNNGVNPIKEAEKAVVTNDATEVLLHAAPTDAGNAERFTALHGNNVRFNHTTQQWLIWDGISWKRDSVGRIHQLAIDTAKQFQEAIINSEAEISLKQTAMKLALGLENEKHRASMLRTAATDPKLATEETMYDADTMLLGVRNGVIDLRDGTFRESRQEDYITKLTNVAYDPDATCPRFERFMLEVFDNDPEVVAYVQRAIGYSLTGDTREQVMFLLYGNGRNGKSTLLEIMGALLGQYADTTPFTTFDAGSQNEQTNDLAKLKGSRFVSIVETDEDRRLNEAKVKMVTGQDTISARFLRQEFFNYKPQFKIWLAVNHKPQIRGTDNGIWRRLQTIPFTVNFEGREDKSLDKTLRAELPGILNWALRGVAEWQRIGLATPAKLVNAAKEYRHDNDIVAKWIEERVTVEDGASVAVALAYEDFSEWCKAAGYRFVITKDSFSKRMSEKGYTAIPKKHKGKTTRMYEGIGVSNLPDIEGLY